MNILGVDRSHLNSHLPLASLVTKGIKFIFFKATQGETYIDATFNQAWQEAKGIPELMRGCYHFLDPRFEGTAQAKHYLSLGVNFSSPGALPPCIDVEDLVGTNEADTQAANKWVANNWQLSLQRLNDFLAYVHQQTGKQCIIYTYNNYPKEYFHGHGFPNNPMWLSSLQATCPARYDTGRQPEFWQNTYNWSGTDMDGDCFTGDAAALNKLANIS